MEDQGPLGEDGRNGGVTGVRYATVVAAGMIGGIFGGLLRVPLSIMAPEWIFSVFPVVLGALCATGLAHLVSGRYGGQLSRVVLAALSVAALCALINVALLLAVTVGALHPMWVLGPLGFLMGFAEALTVGTVAGVTAIRGGPARGRSNLRVWALILGGSALLLFGAFALPGALACSAEERAVFEEFDQYGGFRVSPTGNAGSGSCAAYYQTRDPSEKVLAYFEEQFEGNGWDERPVESYRIAVQDGKEVCVPMDSIAERNGFRYQVIVEEISPNAGERGSGTQIAAHVSRVPEGEPNIRPGGPPPGCRLASPVTSLKTTSWG